jgi:hypothetical protein
MSSAFHSLCFSCLSFIVLFLQYCLCSFCILPLLLRSWLTLIMVLYMELPWVTWQLRESIRSVPLYVTPKIIETGTTSLANNFVLFASYHFLSAQKTPHDFLVGLLQSYNWDYCSGKLYLDLYRTIIKVLQLLFPK